MVRDDYLIAVHYVRGAFFLDLVGSFPLSLLLEIISDDGEANAASRLNRQLRLIRIIKLNRLLRLAKLSKNLKYLELVIKSAARTERPPATRRAGEAAVPADAAGGGAVLAGC